MTAIVVASRALRHFSRMTVPPGACWFCEGFGDLRPYAHVETPRKHFLDAHTACAEKWTGDGLTEMVGDGSEVG